MYYIILTFRYLNKKKSYKSLTKGESKNNDKFDEEKEKNAGRLIEDEKEEVGNVSLHI